MREIKFRVFFYDGTDYRSGGMISLGEAMLEEYVVIKFDDRNTLLPFDECSILMQYTGLKDKNGKEIYESDHDQNFDVVKWCDKRNGWSVWAYDYPTKEYVFCHCYECEGNFELSEALKDFEVIGNIYEVSK